MRKPRHSGISFKTEGGLSVPSRQEAKMHSPQFFSSLEVHQLFFLRKESELNDIVSCVLSPRLSPHSAAGSTAEGTCPEQNKVCTSGPFQTWRWRQPINRARGRWTAPGRAQASRLLNSPNTTCFPSSQSHLEQVMKNWQPLVLGPLFA